MRARTKRLWVIGVAAVMLSGAAALTLRAFGEWSMYYYTPGDIAEEGGVAPGRTIRLGGMVENGSLRYGEGAQIFFTVTDGAEKVVVRYEGVVPDLFREGQGVVADGAFDVGAPDMFVASRILAKHDENYVPRELRDLPQHAPGQATGDAAR